ncbi:MAG: hypothetical protein NWS85_00770, partial [Hydrogenophaga sp.]|nr:hypothetical protein [Hydrogenophaga sp.]
MQLHPSCAPATSTTHSARVRLGVRVKRLLGVMSAAVFWVGAPAWAQNTDLSACMAELRPAARSG